MLRIWIGMGLLPLAAVAQRDFWELPPISYSDTAASGAVERLGELELEGLGALDRLSRVLAELDVPESSQVLVFSKTSEQNGLIHPGNPRSLFFSENTYVGYVPGGAIEVAAEDPVLGPVYYFIKTRDDGGLQVMRDTSSCLSCHATARTEGVPGLLVRSVFPSADGHLLMQLGSTTVTDATPIAERWGGWYVTGTSELPHLGNRVFTVDGELGPERSELADLTGRIDVSRYLRPTSDVVALTVLEHQCQMHNLLTAAGMRYRRARFLAQAIDPQADPDAGQAGRLADSEAAKVVEALLFKNEAELGDGLEGDPEFQRDFAARFPRTAAGDSLADFKLYRQIFKNRCSYMVYSAAFDGLPGRVKSKVISGLEDALTGDGEAGAHLPESEKRRIVAILAATLPVWEKKE